MHHAQHLKIKDGGISDMISFLNFHTLFIREDRLFHIFSSSFIRLLSSGGCNKVPDYRLLQPRFVSDSKYR